MYWRGLSHESQRRPTNRPDRRVPVLLTTVVTANGSLVYLRQQSLDGFQLVGQTTGIWRPRTGQSIFSSVERVSTQNGSYHFTYNLPAYIVESEQSGAVIRWPLMISVTRNANGIVTVDHTWGPCDLVGQ